MKISTRLAFAAVFAGLVASCAALEVERAKNAQPVGSAFSKSLYKEYLALATSERSKGHFGASDIYAFRAIAAAEGKEFMPDFVERERLPKQPASELRGARGKLLQLLADGARTKAPAGAAKAQASFDCWLEEARQGDTSPLVEQCRKGFVAAMADVEAGLKPPPRVEAAKVSRRFVVYFPLNSAKLSPAATNVVLQAIDFAKGVGAKTVSFAGHADRAGATGYNAELSELRAGAVAKQFETGGVDTYLFDITAFGEASPATRTVDGKQDGKNRRVTITVSN